MEYNYMKDFKLWDKQNNRWFDTEGDADQIQDIVYLDWYLSGPNIGEIQIKLREAYWNRFAIVPRGDDGVFCYTEDF